MRKLTLLLIVLIAISSISFGQERHDKCATMHNLQDHIRQMYISRAQLDEYEVNLQNAIVEEKSNRAATLITIPIVFHVIHNGDAYGANENVPDEQLISQIAALNRDFRRQNFDTVNTPAVFKSIAADADIEFCLARFDEAGQLHSGINRYNLGQSDWDRPDIETMVKPGTVWDSEEYLNVWVIRFDQSTGAVLENVLGYAQFPGMAANTDGVAIRFDAIGTEGASLPSSRVLGRTTVHEVGHWLGLLHTWGDDDGACTGDDMVGDTPNSWDSYFGCPSFPQTSCSSQDMFMNYMDYTDDDCSNIFTQGQVDRMRGVLAMPSAMGGRLEITNVDYVCNYYLDIGIAAIHNPSTNMCNNDFVPVIEVVNGASTTLTNMQVIYSFDGGPSDIFNWAGSVAGGESLKLELPIQTLSNGAHSINVTLFDANGQGNDDYAGNDNMNIAFTITESGNGNSLPLAEGVESALFPFTNWSVDNPDGDRAWDRTTAASGYGTSSACAKFDNFTGGVPSPNGRVDAYITPDFDFSGANFPYVTFDYAYAARGASQFDTMAVYYSASCGDNWVKVWEKWGSDLSTAPNQATDFIPTNSEWADDAIGLNALKGSPRVRLRFENRSGNGNNLYLDNININDFPVGIEDNELPLAEVKVYPNPTTNVLHIEAVDLWSYESMQIVNTLGEIVLSENVTPSNRLTLDVSTLTQGIYLVRLQNGTQSVDTKVLIAD